MIIQRFANFTHVYSAAHLKRITIMHLTQLLDLRSGQGLIYFYRCKASNAVDQHQ